MSETPALSSSRAAALYIGALLGPALLLLPGLAAQLAGPASILAWLGLLALSGLLALVFTRLGTQVGGSSGVSGYTAAGLGATAGRAVGWCFLAGVLTGAPMVSVIGGGYVESLLGGGRPVSLASAAVLLLLVTALTFGGARTTSGLQLGLVALLVALIVVAVLGSAPTARAEHWTPFLPHGWASVGAAGSALMLSFVGWEAIAPLTARLREPRRQLPKVIAVAFGVTALIYLALAAATIGVLGPRAGSAVPLADLLHVATGRIGAVVAVVLAVLLTLATANAYLTGARALAGELRRAEGRTGEVTVLRIGLLAAGVLLLGGSALGWLDTAALVAVPTTLFLTVYLACTAAAARVLSGAARVAAVLACACVLGVLAFSGWTLLVALAVLLAAACTGRSHRVVYTPVGSA